MIWRAGISLLVVVGLLFSASVRVAATLDGYPLRVFPLAADLRPLSAFAQSAHPSRCNNYQLTIRYVSGGAALGHIGIIYRIHNLSGHPCTLQGYPGVELFNRNFHSLPTHVSRGGGYIIVGRPREPLVALDDRHDAYFGLEFHDVPADNQSCTQVRYLMITPPNDYLPIVIRSGGIAPCGGQVIVSPVHSNNSID